MAIKAKGQSWHYVLLLVLALAAWGLEQWKPGLLRGLADRPATEDGGPSIEGGYERFDGCRWVADSRNDGDSFKIRLPDQRVVILRLYFADAPESQFRTYGGGRSNHKRIGEQAEALGTTPDGAVEIGQLAKKKVAAWLASQPFTIFTEWDDPFGDERYHAFVRLSDGGWLHERLAEEGLVRIHTKGATLPDGTPEGWQRRKLEDLARHARS